MKKAHLFCTRWWFFLCEIPPAIVLIASIRYNSSMTTALKLYPLIVFCCLFIVFFFLYFFRTISISSEEIRTHGLFSSKDSATIKEDTTLVVTLLPKRKLRVELEGLSKSPGFSWIKGGEYEECSINLYRERAIGDQATVKKLIKYFGVDKTDADLLFNSSNYHKDYEGFTISSGVVDENKLIRINFTETL